MAPDTPHPLLSGLPAQLSCLHPSGQFAWFTTPKTRGTPNLGGGGGRSPTTVAQHLTPSLPSTLGLPITPPCPALPLCSGNQGRVYGKEVSPPATLHLALASKGFLQPPLLAHRRCHMPDSLPSCTWLWLTLRRVQSLLTQAWMPPCSASVSVSSSCFICISDTGDVHKPHPWGWGPREWRGGGGRQEPTLLLRRHRPQAISDSGWAPWLFPGRSPRPTLTSRLPRQREEESGARNPSLPSGEEPAQLPELGGEAKWSRSTDTMGSHWGQELKVEPHHKLRHSQTRRVVGC